MRLGQGIGVAREHQHRLAEDCEVGNAAGVMIGLADALGCPRGDAAGQESHDVQLLPDLEVVTDGDGDLGVVVHRWAPCWRSPRNMNEASARRLDIRAGNRKSVGEGKMWYVGLDLGGGRIIKQ